ncbi:GATA-binding factor C [Eumeta japonica]|uniref:GATA-binding factor C n=1 Tax=Eumeta variegata TaxID=151549 RepID=A0A4C1YBY8_EUMVA|nr:GATA-binding factor C [Eumeta japonica]
MLSRITCTGRSLSGGGGQVCRPHFHTPLHPWLESKALGGGAWGGGFQQEGGGAGAGADKPLSPAQHPHPHPLFSFPPTPPKDSTPDSVAAAALGQQDYQAAVAHATAMSVAFMQQQQELPLCGDVKPMMGAPAAKPREGAPPDGCPQESSQPPAPGDYSAQYNGAAAGTDYGYSYPGKGFGGAPQPAKPRPNKTRTSAGEWPPHRHCRPRPVPAALIRPFTAHQRRRFHRARRAPPAPYRPPSPWRAPPAAALDATGDGPLTHADRSGLGFHFGGAA